MTVLIDCTRMTCVENLSLSAARVRIVEVLKLEVKQVDERT